MKIIKIFIWGISICIAIIILLLAVWEFLEWQMHDYAPNYAEIQYCIEHGHQWDYDQDTCVMPQISD